MKHGELYNLAYKVMMDAHKGQVDKLGAPYFEHPMVVASMVKDENAKVVALLHDVVEDTKVTLLHLALMNFPQFIIEAVDAISRRKDEQYFVYIERVKQNTLAKEVKIADLNHNLDPVRLSGMPEKGQISLRRRYNKALNILQNS